MDELVLAREAEAAGEHAEPPHVFGRVYSGRACPARQAVPGAHVGAKHGQRVVVEGRAHRSAIYLSQPESPSAQYTLHHGSSLVLSSGPSLLARSDWKLDRSSP